MCGITGLIAPEISTDSLNQMLQVMYHRGPDDQGKEIITFNHFQVGLGSTRLAIIDLSPAGHMPMYDTDTGNWIVYNGEIYNYHELRAELARYGKRFHSQTDTEVILKSYATWGIDCINRFRGMFVFAIWDNARKELVLARDRLGEKPLYYYHDPQRSLFLFASEVRTLLASGFVPKRIDPTALSIYLHNGFIVSPITIIRDVRSLLPGHWMRVGSDGKTIECRCYWKLGRSSSDLTKKDQHVEELQEILAEATKQRLISDVPLGIFLSGGLDSSAITAIATKSSKSIRTFSIGFLESKYDESIYAKRVSSYFKTEHQTVYLSAEEFEHWLDDGLTAMDQPTFDGLNAYYVSRLARSSGITVAISGLGGDELFGGYPHFWQAPHIARFLRLKKYFPMNVAKFVKRHATELHGWRKTLSVFDLDVPEHYTALASYQITQSIFPDQFLESLIKEHDDIKDVWLGLPIDFINFLEWNNEDHDLLTQISKYTIYIFEGERLLRDTDSMGMANSLEIRTVFTDHKLIEAVWQIPAQIRCAKPPNKPFEYNLVKPFLESAYEMRKKHGFLFPFTKWLQQPTIHKRIQDTLFDSNLNSQAGLNDKAVKKIVQKQSYIPWSRTWCLYVLLDWVRRYGVSI